MSDWRYIASRLNGDGTETFLDYNVPLGGAQIVEDLSGPGQISGSISPEVNRLQEDGRPLFEEWGTALYAEKDGIIRGGAIITDLEEDGPTLSITSTGFTSFLSGRPFLHYLRETGIDPLDVIREMWRHTQAWRGGNLGLTIDGTKSKVKLGTPVDPEDGETGPYELARWKTFDMGAEFDTLAEETPFDYRVDHKWDGERITHHLVIGYPELGTRRPNLRFVVGENVREVPKLKYGGDDYASGVLLVGAGEGRDMVTQIADQVPARLSRIVVVEDKTITTKKRALAAAEAEARLRVGLADFGEDLVISEHPNAPVGSYTVGDEIGVTTAKKGWTDGQTVWVRILSKTLDPATGTTRITIIRTEKVTQ